jgi:hypothetical protein
VARLRDSHVRFWNPEQLSTIKIGRRTFVAASELDAYIERRSERRPVWASNNGLLIAASQSGGDIPVLTCASTCFVSGLVS